MRRGGRGKGSRAQPAALLDVAFGLLLGIILLVAGPGLGVLAWFGLPLLVLLLLTFAAQRLRRRRSRPGRAS